MDHQTIWEPDILFEENSNMAGQEISSVDKGDTVQTFQVLPEQAGERLDKFLSMACSGYSRSFIQKLAKDGRVLVNQKAQKSNYKECPMVCFPGGLPVLPLGEW